MHNLYLYDGVVYHEDGEGLLHSQWISKEIAQKMQERLLENGVCVAYYYHED